ncbi:MAG: helix-turn-helix domain-containing protein [bacterium]|nr:helix-turn-helix domain-containing protein [bacterium]
MAVSPKQIDEAKLYNVMEVSEILNVTEQTVRKHLRYSLLKGKKIGKRWYIEGREIKKFIEG